MSVVPGQVETDQQPPMAVPLRQFVLALGFLLSGLSVGLLDAVGLAPGLARLAHLHLLLVGWVCLTIMGAMTQFVPVWSAVPLHSRRLATAALWLVTVGLVGFALSLSLTAFSALIVSGSVLLLGFWLFVYNLARTLARVDRYDVTERHFVYALAFFVLATALGFSLAVGYTAPLFDRLGIARGAVVEAHATLAVFGAVLTTVVGALYQLATMFTQTELGAVDEWIQRGERVAYPAGVLALAAGRLVGHSWIARGGGVLVATALFGVGVVLARRLRETSVSRTPMLSRYAVVAGSLLAWSVLAAYAWLTRPLDPAVTFGPPGAAHLLAFGAVGFVVLGTLYHVVPFIVWEHRYSDLLGYEQVPMIDDLYDGRLAAVDGGCLLAGLGVLTVDGLVGLPGPATVAGGLLSVGGGVVFVGNMLLVLREHSPHSLSGILFETLADTQEEGEPFADDGSPAGRSE